MSCKMGRGMQDGVRNPGGEDDQLRREGIKKMHKGSGAFGPTATSSRWAGGPMTRDSHERLYAPVRVRERSLREAQ